MNRIFGPGFWYKLFFSLVWVGIIVAVHLYNTQIQDLTDLGIQPRTTVGALGIATAPFLHADWTHLWSNMLPLFFAMLAIMVAFEHVSDRVIPQIYVFSGIIVWLVARPSNHIGASGVVYGLISFLFFSGVFRKQRTSIALAILVVFLNQGIIWGFVPREGMSWESHLAGAFVGMALAFFYRKTPSLLDPPEDDESTPSPDIPEAVWNYRQHTDAAKSAAQLDAPKRGSADEKRLTSGHDSDGSGDIEGH
ncbi:MAG: rhomboid family intramembrane serine protease [Bacteroidota bacterium]